MFSPVISPRVVRSFVQHIDATPESVFPLLCPVMEKAWLPGWDCRMVHSNSGVAERGAVFETPHAKGVTRWIVTEYEHARRVAFARWQPDGLMVHVEITLGRELNGTTAVCIAYTFTPTDDESREILAASTEKEWLDTMAQWQGSMNAWFAKRPDRAMAAAR